MLLYKSLLVAGLSLPLLFGAASAFEETASESTAPIAQTAGETAPAATDGDGAEVVVAEKDKVVCKYIKTTGSRFGTKECMTQSQWDLQRKNSQEEAARMQRGGGVDN